MYYKKKAKIILEHFGVYGIGNFDLNEKDLTMLLEILDKKNIKKEVKSFYEQLEKQRMG